MKTKLVFEIPDDNDHAMTERKKLERLIRVDELCGVLWNLSEAPDIPDDVKKVVRDELDDARIDLHNLYC